MNNAFQRLTIAAMTAFGITSASAADVVGPVAETPLNKCIETALKALPGDYSSQRITDIEPKTPYYHEIFQINASKLPNHMIGVKVMVLGAEGKDPEDLQITGLHDGNRGKKERIAFLTAVKPHNVSGLNHTLMIEWDRPNNDPNKKQDMLKVERDALGVLEDIRTCAAKTNVKALTM